MIRRHGGHGRHRGHGRQGRRAAVLVTLAGLLGSALVSATVATTGAVASEPVPGQTTLVPEVPRTDTPIIPNGQIWDMEVIGTRVFIAGTFTSIQNVGGPSVPQQYLAAYDFNTGKVDMNFRPTFDGVVNAVEASPDGTSLYVAGQFNTIDGVTKRKIARLDPATGAPVAAFTATANAQATALAVSNGSVYVGGQFKTINGAAEGGLAALNPSTGAVDTGFNLPLAGGLGTGGLLTVQQLRLTHDGTKLIVIHTGRTIAGLPRTGVGIIDTASKTVLPWHSTIWDDNLSRTGGIQHIYAGDVSPDGSYLVVTAGSGGDVPPTSDTAMAFPVNGGEGVQPLWVSRHFDSVYSVAITESAVYLGGHFSWQPSPTAPDPYPGLPNVGYGTGQGLSGYGLGDEVVKVVGHLGAVDPKTGKSLGAWDPGSNSFAGDKAMLATPRGLFVGGDGMIKGGKRVGRVAFFDLNTAPAATPVDTTVDSPIEGRVVPSGQTFTISGTAVSPSGVNKVQVEIQDRTTKKYLQPDLTTWGSDKPIAATVADPGATTTTWSLALPSGLPGDPYQFLAKAFGVNGQSDPNKAVRRMEAFNFGDLTPTTAISTPPAGIVTTLDFVITGTAKDDHGVVAMSYWFRDSDNNYLQNDGTVSPTFNSFSGQPDVIDSPSPTWSYEVVLPHEGKWRMNASSVDDAGQTDLRGTVRDWTVTATGVAPTVAITAPVAMTPPAAPGTLTVSPGTRITFTGTAASSQNLTSVGVFLRNGTTKQALAVDGSWSVNNVAGYYRVSPLNLSAPTYSWSYTSVPLTPGIYDFRVRATDSFGLTTSSANLGLLTVTVEVPGDAFPDGQLSFTGTDNTLQVLHLNLTGTATDDHGVTAVNIALFDSDTNRYVQPNGTLAAQFATLPATLGSPGAPSTTFTLSTDLPSQGNYGVTAWAVDTSGQQDISTVGSTARYMVYPGDQPPTLDPSLGSPADGATLTGSHIVVSGRAIDDIAMASVRITFTDSTGNTMSSAGVFSPGVRFVNAVLTSIGSPGSNFGYASPTIPPGVYTVSVQAVDNHGFVQLVPRVVTVTVTP
jgi:hypothetical protein